MKIIVTKQNANGTYDSVGMSNRALFSEYKTLRGAIKYGARTFANNRPFRVEVYPSGNIYDECNWILEFNAQGERVSHL